ncbi:MAG: sulfatase/phosphatase domain-containing protein, partial [Verrucomicrobiota bacterium]
KAGVKNDAPIYLQDVMPTSLDLAGIEKPEHVEFQSLKPIWEGSSDGYSEIYGGYLKSQRCIIKDGMKLLAYPNAKKLLLFDLKNDPLEMTDISDKHPELVKSLFADLVKLQNEMDDDVDLKAVFEL